MCGGCYDIFLKYLSSAFLVLQVFDEDFKLSSWSSSSSSGPSAASDLPGTTSSEI